MSAAAARPAGRARWRPVSPAPPARPVFQGEAAEAARSPEPRSAGPGRLPPRRPRCLGTRHQATSTSRLDHLQDAPGERTGKEDPERKQLSQGTSLDGGQEGGRAEGSAPWYVAVVYEKEQDLAALGEEINRLSQYEAECARKDGIISVLREEVESLKKQLDLLKDTVITEDTETEQKSLSKEVTKEVHSTVDAERAFQEQSEAEEQAVTAKVTELQKTNQELCEELQKAKNDYNMATGALSSLQRQLEIQESQLRRTTSEKEMLQKELRERENQLRAMSIKFCNLREERKHEEMMATIEKENCSLRQTVTKQESKLAEQNKLISDLKSTASQLQAKVLVNEYHIQEQQQAQEAIQSQADTLQHMEQQTKVALQCITSRFERYRSKIIQATFSTAGSKSPQAELTDEEVLEAMQKIINDRMEFHQMLKQKGVKVPSLYSLDTSTSAPTNTKSTRKNPLK